MKKKLAILLLSACLVAGCGSKSLITTKNKPIENAVYTSDSVSLASYTGLKAEKKNYIVTDKAVEDKIHESLMEFADYESVTRASKTGDYVQTDFKASIDGSVVLQENQYDVILGAEEFGKEFDEKMTGVSIGDELRFSLDFASDFVDVEWAGKTVDFEIRVTDIQQELLPELTDTFISENMGYDSYEQFSDAIRKELTDSYETESTQELQENLIQQVVDTSSILQYSKEDYKKRRIPLIMHF
ncbi:Trigger factor [Eubacterium plexicaudatum ASF492]|nr:Trigger factor [Eubacterium plexicaudatum ASF492]